MSLLKVGDQIADFKVKNDQGEEVTLSKYKGKKLIMYFYPKALTPGCTSQACSIQSTKKKLERLGYQIVGVSGDSPEKLTKFKEKKNLDFELLADTERTLSTMMGVWGSKSFMGKIFDGIRRTTFVMDESGKITHVIDKVKTKTHGEDLLELLK